MKLSTTIKKTFFEMKMHDLNEEGYFIEYKEEKNFWSKRLNKISVKNTGEPKERTEIVFLVGNKPYRFRIAEISYTHIVPKKYASAITTDYAYAIKCVPLTHEEREPSHQIPRFEKRGMKRVTRLTTRKEDAYGFPK